MAEPNSFHYDAKTNDAFLNYQKILFFPKDLQEKYSKMLSIFDKNGDNKIDNNELKFIWSQVKAFAGNDNTLSVEEADDCVMDSASGMKNYLGALFTREKVNAQELFDFLKVLTNTIMPKESAKGTSTTGTDMRANIAREAKSRGTELTDAEIEKWNNIINAEAQRYNVPPEVLIVIIGRECHFVDPTNNKDGCMQVIPSSVSSIKKDRWGIYDKVNSECRNDTIQNLKVHDLTDRSTGIKAGVLVFQTNYAQAVARIKGWKVGKQPDIAKAAEELKNGTVNLTPSEAKEAMRMALRDYNGSSLKESYAADCIKRLDEMDYDYTRPIF